MRPVAASVREKQKREPMPCASRTCRGFSTRHPWRDEKASAPASPPAGPIPPCPAMLGALNGGLRQKPRPHQKPQPPRFARRLFGSRSAILCRHGAWSTAPTPALPRKRGREPFRFLIGCCCCRCLAVASAFLPHCMAPSIAAIGGGEGSRFASTARCESERPAVMFGRAGGQSGVPAR